MNRARSSPRGPTRQRTAAAPRGINPGSVGGPGGCPQPSPPPQSPPPLPPPSSGGCAAPSHPHYPQTWTRKTAGTNLTRFWLRRRATNPRLPRPTPLRNTHNSDRSSPGFSAGEEQEAEEAAAAARLSPARPRPPHPHWWLGRAGRGTSGTSIGCLCLPSGTPPSRGWLGRPSIRLRPHPQRCHSTPRSASPRLSAASLPSSTPPPPTLPPPRVRQGQAARVSLPAAPAVGSVPGVWGLSGARAAREAEAGTACPRSGLDA